MPKIEILVVSAACLLSACGSGDMPQGSTSASAFVKMLDREWQISGTCEAAGDDLTFVGPGDPMLSIGIDTASNSGAVGNFSSASEGFGIIIGSPNVPEPVVRREGDAFAISGTFTVYGEEHVDGSVLVDCGG